MTNLWPQDFKKNTLTPPLQVLKEQAAILGKITNGKVQAEVFPMAIVEAITCGLQNHFTYQFEIIGPYVNNFKFTAIRISHDISLYPVKMLIDKQIGKELNLTDVPFGSEYTADSPENFEEILGYIFKSNRLGQIIGSIISLSE